MMGTYSTVLGYSTDLSYASHLMSSCPPVCSIYQIIERVKINDLAGIDQRWHCPEMKRFSCALPSIFHHI